MNMTAPTTIDEARRLYHPKLRYSEVISLCALFGFTETAARSLIEGPSAPVKGKAYGSTERLVKGERKPTTRRKIYDREDIITACS